MRRGDGGGGEKHGVSRRGGNEKEKVRRGDGVEGGRGGEEEEAEYHIY